jgi:hypothetical protein
MAEVSVELGVEGGVSGDMDGDRWRLLEITYWSSVCMTDACGDQKRFSRKLAY